MDIKFSLIYDTITLNIQDGDGRGREEGNEYLYERSFAYIAQVIAVDAIKQLQIVNFCRVSHETFAYRHETCSETASPMEQVEKAPPRFV